MTVVPVGRSRFGLLLAAGQVRYQLLLLLRSPIGTFTALVIPLMVLVALNLATPQVALRELHGIRYADFLAPAMATFALLKSTRSPPWSSPARRAYSSGYTARRCR